MHPFAGAGRTPYTLGMLLQASRVLRFLVSGAASAAFNISILYLLVDFVGLYYLAASILSYLVSILFGFALQKFWAFADRSLERSHLQLASFTGVALMNLCINTALMYFFVSIIGFWYIAAQIIAAMLVAGISFFAYGHIFRPADVPASSQPVSDYFRSGAE